MYKFVIKDTCQLLLREAVPRLVRLTDKKLYGDINGKTQEHTILVFIPLILNVNTFVPVACSLLPIVDKPHLYIYNLQISFS